MTGPDQWIKTGDTLPEVTAVLRDGAGDPVNIFGATVEFIMRPIRSGEVVLHAEAENRDTDAEGTNRGEVAYYWVEGDTDVAGGYYAEWRVTYGGGDVETFPNDGYKTFAIVDNLPAVGS